MTFYRVCWQTLKSIWQSSGLSSHSYLVTNLLAASADHVDIKNLIKTLKIVDGNFLNVLRRVYILGVSCSTSSHMHFMIAWRDRVSRRINPLLPPKVEPLSYRGSQSFRYSQRPCHCCVHSLRAVGRNGEFGGVDHISPSSSCSPTSRTS